MYNKDMDISPEKDSIIKPIIKDDNRDLLLKLKNLEEPGLEELGPKGRKLGDLEKEIRKRVDLPKPEC